MLPLPQQPDDFVNGMLTTESNLEPAPLEVTLYRNEIKLAFPDDGTLPTREETTWLSVTEKYVLRRYGRR